MSEKTINESVNQWGQSENNWLAKYYTLTKAGRKQLGVESEGWDRLCLAIRQIMQSA
jgi:PadR family transcriptional regulator PadR